MPTVGNRHWYKNGAWPRSAIYVGRPTTLADKIFRAQPHVRNGTALGNVNVDLAAYRRWLFVKIKDRDNSVMGVLRSIRADDVRICSCAPRPCHADIILKAWKWLNAQEE